MDKKTQLYHCTHDGCNKFVQWYNYCFCCFDYICPQHRHMLEMGNWKFELCKGCIDRLEGEILQLIEALREINYDS